MFFYLCPHTIKWSRGHIDLLSFDSVISIVPGLNDQRHVFGLHFCWSVTQIQISEIGFDEHYSPLLKSQKDQKPLRHCILNFYCFSCTCKKSTCTFSILKKQDELNHKFLQHNPLVHPKLVRLTSDFLFRKKNHTQTVTLQTHVVVRSNNYFFPRMKWCIF